MATDDPKNPVGPGPLRLGAQVIDPPILQAPMAGFSNFAFRRIVRELAAQGCCIPR